MKRIFKILFYCVIGTVSIVGIYLGAEYVLSRSTVEGKKAQQQHLIFLMSNGVHTDIVLPIKSKLIIWTDLFPFENTVGQSTHFDYVGIGWGDKGFYLDTPEWKDLKASIAFVAATGLGESALHVTFYPKPKENDLTKAIWISDDQYLSIISSVKESLDLKNNQPILVKTDAQYGNDDAFYEAKGSYSIFFTCNTWTNSVLKKANMKASKWAAFDDGILSQYEN